MVTAPALEPAGSADEYNLQALERSKRQFFLNTVTGKQIKG